VESAAALSAAICNKIEENGMIEVEQFVCHHVKDESPDAGRPARWAMYTQEKNVFVVFRATDADFDWIVNASMILLRSLPNYQRVKVHAGYSTEIDYEYDDLVRFLVRVMQQEEALSIIITGHSKGGALAHVFAERLVSDSKQENALQAATITAITFAAPMAFWYQRPEEAPQLDYIHNYVISSDPVPYFPALIGNKDAVHGLTLRKYASLPIYVHSLLLLFTTSLEGVAKEVEMRSQYEYIKSFGPVGNIYLAEDIVNDVEAGYTKTTSDNFHGIVSGKSGNLESTLNFEHHRMVHYARIAANRSQRFQLNLGKARKGDKYAQYYVASFYFRGVGVRKNEKAAFDWFKKSAARGHAGAQYEVARFYNSGLGGVTLNEDTANIYFDQAMSQEQPPPEDHPMIDRWKTLVQLLYYDIKE
jgi:hypothetical protein